MSTSSIELAEIDVSDISRLFAEIAEIKMALGQGFLNLDLFREQVALQEKSLKDTLASSRKDLLIKESDLRERWNQILNEHSIPLEESDFWVLDVSSSCLVRRPEVGSPQSGETPTSFT